MFPIVIPTLLLLPLLSAQSVKVPSSVYDILPFCDNSTGIYSTATLIEYVTVMPNIYTNTVHPTQETSNPSYPTQESVSSGRESLPLLMGLSLMFL